MSFIRYDMSGKNRERNYQPKWYRFLVILFFVPFFVSFIILPYLYYSANDTTTITIKNKERACYSRNNCKYLIYTENEVFQDTDDLFAGKFNSADIYNQLDNGKTCVVRLRGRRLPVFSAFRNILSVEYCR